MAQMEQLDLAPFIRTLAADERDLEGRLHPAGTAVLCNGLAPAQFMEDTPRNRDAFAGLGFAWSDSVRQRDFFVDPAAYSAPLRDGIGRAAAAMKHFSGSIEDNLFALRGQPFPRLSVPMYFHLLPFEWEPATREVAPVADLTAAVLNALAGAAGLPGIADQPEHVRSLLARINNVRVFECRRKAAAVHVIVAFLTAIRFERGREPAIIPIDHATLDAVSMAYDGWLAGSGRAAPALSAFTLGTALPPGETLEGSAAGRRWVLVSFPHAAGAGAPAAKWKTRLPRRFGDRLSIQYFVEALEPETSAERLLRIRQAVDQQLAAGATSLTVGKLADATGCRKAVVIDALETLRDQAPEQYHVYALEGQPAVRVPRPGDKPSWNRPSAWRVFLRRHALGMCGMLIAVIATRVDGWFHLAGGAAIAVAALVGYFANQIDKFVHYCASRSKE